MSALRRRKLEGAPRWMVTFADLMALLFALFVLLLSFAEISEETFQKNAGPLREAFGRGDKVLRTTSLPRPQVGEAGPGRAETQAETAAGIVARGRRAQVKRDFLFQFRRIFERELADARVVLLDAGDRIIIRFPGTTTFQPGSAELSEGFGPTIQRIASVLKATKGRILVSGHTDDTPIATARFRSNWDLSSARAATVVHYLVDRAGLAPGRITAQGYADSRPLAANDNPGNRARNRRVEIALEITDFQP